MLKTTYTRFYLIMFLYIPEIRWPLWMPDLSFYYTHPPLLIPPTTRPVFIFHPSALLFFLLSYSLFTPPFLKLNYPLPFWLPPTIHRRKTSRCCHFILLLLLFFVFPSLFDIRLSNYHVRKLPWLSRQSDRLLTDRSLVRSQAEAPFLLFCSLLKTTYIDFMTTVKKVRLPWVSNPRPRG